MATPQYEVWNEGRVVGVSAYEIYTRNLHAVRPDATPVDEREWLASSLGSGASILIKLEADTSESEDAVHYRDITLPADTQLCAASTIIGSLFDGKGVYNNTTEITSHLATSVASYGNCILNNPTYHPQPQTITSPTGIPCASEYVNNEDQMLNYLKIRDGIVIQPGTWFRSGAGLDSPQMDFVPSFSNPPTVRIAYYGQITEDIEILLTGFMYFGVVLGETQIEEGSTVPGSNPTEMYNGSTLGPARYPWANKIVFVGSTNLVDSTKVHMTLSSIYETEMTVEEILTALAYDIPLTTKLNARVSVIYLVPVLLAANIQSDVDLGVPEAIRYISGERLAKDASVIARGGSIPELPGITGNSTLGDLISAEAVRFATDPAFKFPKHLNIKTLDDSHNTLSTEDENGDPLFTTSPLASIDISESAVRRKLSLDLLVYALNSRSSLDIFGDALAQFQYFLSYIRPEDESEDSTWKGWFDLNSAISDSSTSSAKFCADELGTRSGRIGVDSDLSKFLYIANSEPEGDIPSGSIGIGW